GAQGRGTKAESNVLRAAGGRSQGLSGPLGIERADLALDLEVVDRAVPRRQIELEIDLVAVEDAEAGGDDDLLVADPPEALRDDVVAVDRDGAAHRLEEAARHLGRGGAGPQERADHRDVEDVDRALEVEVVEPGVLDLVDRLDLGGWRAVSEDRAAGR